MSLGGEKVKGKVVCRVTDEMGHLKGHYNPNPLVDISEYRVEFEDGSTEEYATNLIAENNFPKSTMRDMSISC